MDDPFDGFAALRSHATRRAFPRKSALLRQGDVSTHAFVVDTGCLRLWHIGEDGTDTTVQFFPEGEVVSSFESFLQGQPSRFGIEAVVPTDVWEISRTVFSDLSAQSPEFRDQMFAVIIARLAVYQNLFLNRIMESPESRYRGLVEQNPKLFDTVPQHYIASYLGVTPVSLSRIRKKVLGR